MATVANTFVPGWFYVDFYYGVEDWVRRFVYVAEETPHGLLFRLVQIETESPYRLQNGDDLIGVYRPLRGHRTGTGEWVLLEGWGEEPMELTHTLVMPTLAAVPA